MLVDKVVEYQSDGTKWNYITNIAQYHEPNFLRCQPESQVPKRFLQDGQLSRLPEEVGDNWQNINMECVIFMQMNAQWAKDHLFDLFRNLVTSVNGAEQVAEIEVDYPSVTLAEFPDALHDANYDLLEDPIADMNGPLLHRYLSPIKEL